MLLSARTCVVLWALLSVAFSQTNNKVVFESEFDRGISLSKLSFTVKDWVVTDGQSHDLEVDQTKSFSGASGDFEFRINRKGSGNTATLMYQRVPVGRTTSSEVSSANFAIFGTLEFVLHTYSDYRTHTISEIMLAQYNKDTSNIWIYGGKSCTGDSVKEEADCLSDNGDMAIICGKQGGSYTFKFYDYVYLGKRKFGQGKSELIGQASIPMWSMNEASRASAQYHYPPVTAPGEVQGFERYHYEPENFQRTPVHLAEHFYAAQEPVLAPRLNRHLNTHYPDFHRKRMEYDNALH